MPATTVSLAPQPGGHWLMKVPVNSGAITFAGASGATVRSEATTLVPIDVCTPAAATALADRPVTLEARTVTARAVQPLQRTQTP